MFLILYQINVIFFYFRYQRKTGRRVTANTADQNYTPAAVADVIITIPPPSSLPRPPLNECIQMHLNYRKASDEYHTYVKV